MLLRSVYSVSIGTFCTQFWRVALTVRRIRSVLSSSVFLPAMNMYLLKSVLEMRGAASVDENRMTHPEMVFEVLEKFF